MMKEEKVSVIVPFHNVEKYLKKCLISIQNQTYKNFEVILINDASTDESRKVAEAFSNNDQRCTIYDVNFHKISKLRNYGLEIASGKYIAWIDSDDFVSNQYIENLHDAIKNSNTDISVCLHASGISGNYSFFNHKKINYKIYNATYLKRHIFSSNKVGGMLWNKLFIAEKAKKIKFIENIQMAEDLAFCIDYLNLCKNISFLKMKLYYYRKRIKSIAHSCLTKKTLTILNSLNYCVKVSQNNFVAFVSAKSWHSVIASTIVFRLLFSKLSHKKLIRAICLKYIKGDQIFVRKNNYINFVYKAFIFITYFLFIFQNKVYLKNLQKKQIKNNLN